VYVIQALAVRAAPAKHHEPIVLLVKQGGVVVPAGRQAWVWAGWAVAATHPGFELSAGAGSCRSGGACGQASVGAGWAVAANAASWVELSTGAGSC